ncbi:MAG: 6-carboxytetrahydropterin synthase [Planctomycetes bacterium]|nr:6-carboxytetrahydropterin synthase [Planctomycetota bacterium]
MFVRVTKHLEFAASHTYSVPGASSEENARLFGACVRHHGHNYMLEVTVEGATDPRTGMVINVLDLKKAMQDVVAELDHRNLNQDVPHFRTHNPSTENIALYLFERLSPRVAPVRLQAVRLREDETLSVEVRDA